MGSEKQEALVTELIEGGADLAGATMGGALGLIGGPPGVAAGAAGGVLVSRGLRRVGAELKRRILGPREEVRVGAALAFAGDYIKSRLDAGDEPRDDGFFEETEGRRVDAEELLEGVLLEAGRSYQEQKVPYLGRLYGGIVFDDRISASYGHFLVKLMERLTYRQLAAIAFLMDPRSADAIVQADVARKEGDLRSTEDIIAELDELARAGVLGIGQPGGHVSNPAATLGGGNFHSTDLVSLALTPIGKDLFELSGLAAIPEEDQAEVLQELQGGWRTRAG